MGRVYRIGTRTSPLALKQVEEIVSLIKRFHPEFTYEILVMETTGDKDKTTPIWMIEGTDFFTKEIDEALLEGGIDLAVHSAKDLPDKTPEGLAIAAITKSIDPYEALVAKGNLKIDELKLGAKIGVSSLRRRTQLKSYRGDFQIVDIRGNIEERLEKLDKEGLDAIIVAACALVRLGLEERISQRIPFEILKPHPLQGSLAVVVEEKNRGLIDLLSVIDSREYIWI